MLNFIALLGWTPPSHTSSYDQPTSTDTQEEDKTSSTTTAAQFQPQEVFSTSELVEQFSLEGLNKRPVTVSKKLLWTNKQHFKRRLKNKKDLEKLAKRLQEELSQHQNITNRYMYVYMCMMSLLQLCQDSDMCAVIY